MVRTIAGTLVDVGLGRWPASYVAEIVEGRDRSRAGRAAPASGLFLVRVDYGQGSGIRDQSIGNTLDQFFTGSRLIPDP
jgi:tRNA pseudouridine38-40 synthase